MLTTINIQVGRVWFSKLATSNLMTEQVARISNTFCHGILLPAFQNVWYQQT